jgi:metallo-beta-lactamase family protein
LKLHFFGANRQVTGSRYCLEFDGKVILIDCGMFQEREFKHRNWEDCPIDASSIDAAVLTHAHIDHCGLLPRLQKQGFDGTIYCTKPTADLVSIMLRDSAYIQKEDLKYKQKRHKKQGKTSQYPYEPLYNIEDAERTLKLFKGIGYYTATEITEGVLATFHDAGHILGSSSIELTIKNGNKICRIIFSGDIGQWNKPIIRDPVVHPHADFVIMESTYGDRLHEERGDIESQLAEVINRTVERGGKVIIPTFAVERAQELVYYLGRLVHDDRIPDVPIYLDSPMAVDVTDVFYQNREFFDAKMWEQIAQGNSPLRFPGLRLSRSVADSKAINALDTPAVVMSTSGMCTAGRIKHHLSNNIHDPKSTVLFVGYQGRGTLGRLILDGREKVRIHGKERRVKAEIAQIFGFSGHGDRDDLMKWIGAFETPPQHVFLTHGEEESALSLADRIRAEKKFEVTVPEYQASLELQV